MITKPITPAEIYYLLINIIIKIAFLINWLLFISISATFSQNQSNESILPHTLYLKGGGPPPPFSFLFLFCFSNIGNPLTKYKQSLLKKKTDCVVLCRRFSWPYIPKNVCNVRKDKVQQFRFQRIPSTTIARKV